MSDKVKHDEQVKQPGFKQSRLWLWGWRAVHVASYLSLALVLFYIVFGRSLVRSQLISALENIGIQNPSAEVDALNWDGAMVRDLVAQDGRISIGTVSVSYTPDSLINSRVKAINITGLQWLIQYRAGQFDFALPELIEQEREATGGAASNEHPGFDEIVLRSSAIMLDLEGWLLHLPISGKVRYEDDGVYRFEFNTHLFAVPMVMTGFMDPSKDRMELSLVPGKTVKMANTTYEPKGFVRDFLTRGGFKLTLVRDTNEQTPVTIKLAMNTPEVDLSPMGLKAILEKADVSLDLALDNENEIEVLDLNVKAGNARYANYHTGEWGLRVRQEDERINASLTGGPEGVATILQVTMPKIARWRTGVVWGGSYYGEIKYKQLMVLAPLLKQVGVKLESSDKLSLVTTGQWRWPTNQPFVEGFSLEIKELALRASGLGFQLPGQRLSVKDASFVSLFKGQYKAGQVQVDAIKPIVLQAGLLSVDRPAFSVRGIDKNYARSLLAALNTAELQFDFYKSDLKLHMPDIDLTANYESVRIGDVKMHEVEIISHADLAFENNQWIANKSETDLRVRWLEDQAETWRAEGKNTERIYTKLVTKPFVISNQFKDVELGFAVTGVKAEQLGQKTGFDAMTLQGKFNLADGPQFFGQAKLEEGYYEREGQVALKGINLDMPLHWGARRKDGGKYAMGELAISDLRIGKTVLNPIKLATDNEERWISLHGAWELQDDLTVTLKSRFEFDENYQTSFRVDVEMPHHELQEPGRLAELVPDLAGNEFMGGVSAKGYYAWSKGKAKTDIDLIVDHGEFYSRDKDIGLSGIDGKIKLVSLLPIATPSKQRLKVEKFNYGDFEFADGLLLFQIHSLEQIDIAQSKWTLPYGGVARVHAIELNIKNPEVRTNIFFENVSLYSWLNKFTEGKIAGEGKFYGRVPIVYTDELRIGEGFVFSVPGKGRVQLKDQALRSQVMLYIDQVLRNNKNSQLIAQKMDDALKDFQTAHMRVELKRRDGFLDGKINFAGQGNKEGGLAFDSFTINLRGIETSLLRWKSLQQSKDRILRRRLDSLFDFEDDLTTKE